MFVLIVWGRKGRNLFDNRASFLKFFLKKFLRLEFRYPLFQSFEPSSFALAAAKVISLHPIQQVFFKKTLKKVVSLQKQIENTPKRHKIRLKCLSAAAIPLLVQGSHIGN